MLVVALPSSDATLAGRHGRCDYCNIDGWMVLQRCTLFERSLCGGGARVEGLRGSVLYEKFRAPLCASSGRYPSRARGRVPIRFRLPCMSV